MLAMFDRLAVLQPVGRLRNCSHLLHVTPGAYLMTAITFTLEYFISDNPPNCDPFPLKIDFNCEILSFSDVRIT